MSGLEGLGWPTPDAEAEQPASAGCAPTAGCPLPLGTRIRFLKTLTSGPNCEGPGNHYATKGQLGTVAESPYGPDAKPCREGYWVFWDGWSRAPFGARLGEDFEVYQENAEPSHGPSSGS
jgi:hypothetical protein